MQFLMTTQERTLKVIHFAPLTGEYVGEGDVFVPPMTGLPAYSTQVKPPKEKAGAVRVFDVSTQSWSYTENHRGKTVYDKSTAFPYVVSALGPLPENMTEITPDSTYSKWTGKGWVIDETAARLAAALDNKNKKILLSDDALRKMVPLQNAVKHGIATEGEAELLGEWEKYTVLLNRIDVDASDEINWPAIPVHVA